MKRNRVALLLLVASCLVLGSLVLGSFVTYAPSVRATRIQNIYIQRILWHSGISAALQLFAAILLMSHWKLQRPNSASGSPP
jgi:hypothetical protein